MANVEINKINIAICDDEPKVLFEIEQKVKNILKKGNVNAGYYITQKPETLLEWLEEERIDILLLDIDMPRISGMDIAKKIHDGNYNILLIFITNQDALVYDSFRYGPFAFIRKSRYENELSATLERAFEEMNKRSEYYILKQNNQFVRLLFSDILYFESDGNYIKIITKSDRYQQRETLLSLEQNLESKGFIRIHKGFLVNQEAVFMIHSDKIILNTKEELPIGRANRDKVKKELMRYLR